MAEAGEPLTERELEVVRLLATGATNKEIATALTVSPNTVKVHLRNIFAKLGAETRTAVTLAAVRNGWVDAGSVAIEGATGATPAPRSNGEADPGALTSSPVSARVMVPVAPAPKPLPPLSHFRKLALAAGVTVAAASVAVSLPARETPTAGSPLSLRTDIAPGGSVFRLAGETSRWFERERLPAPREFSVAAASGERLYLIGGVAGAPDGAASGDVLIYDPAANTWSLGGAAKPTPVGFAAAATIGDRIFVIGGIKADDEPTARAESYETSTGAWESLASMPFPLAGHAAASVDGRVYVFGGYSGVGLNDVTLEYDPAANAWRKRAPMPTPRALSSAAVLGGRIIVAGGQTGGVDQAACEAYDPASDAWAPCARMTIRRAAFGLAAAGGALYAVGGGGASYLGFSERYDPNRDAWTLFESPRLGDWRNMAVAPLKAGVFVMGGRSGADRLRDTYVYELGSSRAFLPALIQQQTRP